MTVENAARSSGSKWLDSLSFAATPILMILAVHQQLKGMPLTCSALPGMIDDMALMYAVMALLHARPWFALLT
jgi:hypothetical protein